MSQTNNYRYEIKFVLPGEHTELVRSWIISHSNAFQPAYPERWVNSIYFDSYDHSFRIDHLNGIQSRAKLRYRWYGENLDSAQGQLELKVKIGKLGHKIIQPIASSILLHKWDWNQIKAALNDEEGELNELLFATWPTILNHYKRAYYVSADQQIRITLDTDIQVYDQSFGLSPNLTFVKPFVNQVIMEVKADHNESKRISDVLSEFPTYATQFSKYLTGTQI